VSSILPQPQDQNSAEDLTANNRPDFQHHRFSGKMRRYMDRAILFRKYVIRYGSATRISLKRK
jgi:hypothetical protein